MGTQKVCVDQMNERAIKNNDLDDWVVTMKAKADLSIKIVVLHVHNQRLSFKCHLTWY